MNIRESLDIIKTFQTEENILTLVENIDGLERIKTEFKTEIPKDLAEYISNYAPKSDLYFDTVGNPITLYSISNLKKKQEGYNYNAITQKDIEDWSKEWFIIGDEGADPIIINLHSKDSKVKKLIHGCGDWESGNVISDTIGQFLLCSSALHYALNSFEEESITDDENGFCLTPNASEWYFKKMKEWAGNYYTEWCSDFDNH